MKLYVHPVINIQKALYSDNHWTEMFKLVIISNNKKWRFLVVNVLLLECFWLILFTSLDTSKGNLWKANIPYSIHVPVTVNKTHIHNKAFHYVQYNRLNQQVDSIPLTPSKLLEIFKPKKKNLENYSFSY